MQDRCKLYDLFARGCSMEPVRRQQNLKIAGLTFWPSSAVEQLWRQLTEVLPALSSPKLRRRVRGALLILAASRLGTFVPIPNVNLSALPEMDAWSTPAATLQPKSSRKLDRQPLSNSSML